jgi:exopolyphosphatase/guanosine-5'-triphosphate,3'-diphosphate pyrophosphatase
MIQAIIDIGSNTIRLAVYELTRDAQPELLLKKKHQVGLAGFIEHNIMEQTGIDAACKVLEEYKKFLKHFAVENVVAFTTAALRNIENSHAAVSEITKRTGIKITIISGEEEARLDFIGAINSVTETKGILVDVGGGSTELVAYRDKKKERVVSLPLGSLAMYKNFVAGILPTGEEIMAIRAATEECIRKEDIFNSGEYSFICGIGGTFKAAKILHNAIWNCPEENQLIEVWHIADMINRLKCDDGNIPSDLLDLLLNTIPERIKTVVPGMVIIDTLAKYLNSRQIMYSDSGVREGYIYRYIQGGL